MEHDGVCREAVCAEDFFTVRREMYRRDLGWSSDCMQSGPRRRRPNVDTAVICATA